MRPRRGTMLKKSGKRRLWEGAASVSGLVGGGGFLVGSHKNSGAPPEAEGMFLFNV